MVKWYQKQMHYIKEHTINILIKGEKLTTHRLEQLCSV